MKRFLLYISFLLLAFSSQAQNKSEKGNRNGLDTAMFNGAVMIRDTSGDKPIYYLILELQDSAIAYIDSEARLSVPVALINKNTYESYNLDVNGDARVSGDLCVENDDENVLLSSTGSQVRLLDVANPYEPNLTFIAYRAPSYTKSTFDFDGGTHNYIFGAARFDMDGWNNNAIIGDILGGDSYLFSENNVLLGSVYPYPKSGNFRHSFLAGWGTRYNILGDVTSSFIYSNTSLGSDLAGSGTSNQNTFGCVVILLDTLNTQLKVDSSLSHTLAIGGRSTYIEHVRIGTGGFANDSFPDVTYHANEITVVTTADIDERGGNIRVAASRGTGTGTGGDVILSTAATTTAGANQQDLTDRWFVKFESGALSNVESPPSNVIFYSQATNSFTHPINVMTQTQRDAISSPAVGDKVYCSDCTATDASTGVEQTYNGTTWKNHW